MNDTSLYRAFQAAAQRFRGRVALRSDGKSLTYDELEVASRDIGAALVDLGIARGDRIAIWGVNSAEWVMVGLAIQAAGAVLVPVGTRLRGTEMQVVLEDAGVRLIFTDRGFGSYSYVDALLSRDLPALETIAVMDGGSPKDGRVTNLAALRAHGADLDKRELDRRIAEGGPDDVADILFTSGTTGRAKGVPITHGQSIIACRMQALEILGLTSDDVFAVSFPFAHNAGYRAGWQMSLLHGVRIVPVPVIESGLLLRLIEQEGITYLPAAPPVIQALMDHPDLSASNITSLRIISTGGTIIPVRLIEDMKHRLSPSIAITTAYGSTETAGSVTYTELTDSPEIVAHTVGHALSQTEVKIVGPDGRDLPPGEVGEIAIRGPQVFKGYYNNPEATAAAFTSDGFFLSGDAGLMHSNEYFSITDRLKDMFLVGGFNCYPAEIERIMRVMPGVANVAVIGVDDEKMGQVGRAFVVRASGAALSEEDVVAWCKGEMANYKVPRTVRFLDALPLNATGKVSKIELRTAAYD